MKITALFALLCLSMAGTSSTSVERVNEPLELSLLETNTEPIQSSFQGSSIALAALEPDFQPDPVVDHSSNLRGDAQPPLLPVLETSPEAAQQIPSARIEEADADPDAGIPWETSTDATEWGSESGSGSDSGSGSGSYDDGAVSFPNGNPLPGSAGCRLGQNVFQSLVAVALVLSLAL